jgi:hypothetical protein
MKGECDRCGLPSLMRPGRGMFDAGMCDDCTADLEARKRAPIGPDSTG